MIPYFGSISASLSSVRVSVDGAVEDFCVIPYPPGAVVACPGATSFAHARQNNLGSSYLCVTVGTKFGRGERYGLSDVPSAAPSRGMAGFPLPVSAHLERLGILWGFVGLARFLMGNVQEV